MKPGMKVYTDSLDSVEEAVVLARRRKFYTEGELRCMAARTLMAIYMAKRGNNWAGTLWTGATWLRGAIRQFQAIEETKRLGKTFIDRALAGS